MCSVLWVHAQKNDKQEMATDYLSDNASCLHSIHLHQRFAKNLPITAQHKAIAVTGLEGP
jgi:hypothetical protein